MMRPAPLGQVPDRFALRQVNQAEDHQSELDDHQRDDQRKELLDIHAEPL